MSNGAPDTLPPPVIPHGAVPYLGILGGLAGAAYAYLPEHTIASKISGILAGIVGLLLGMGPGWRKPN